MSPESYDVIVVGAGHAGCEAALAAARMGLRVALFTISLETIAKMSCNPAIGGLAKGHLVREIDALGGEMGRAIDRTGIQFRMLNTGKGPAVRAPRAQADKRAYQAEMRRVLETQQGLDLKEAMVEELMVENGEASGVVTRTGTTYRARAVVLTTGTFLRGLIHVGLRSYSGGRAGELAADNLSGSLERLGFELGRLKTGTPPRVHRQSIDFSQLQVQPGDSDPQPFSFSTEKLTQEQVPCHLGHTNEQTHDVIRRNLDRSPLYSGKIVGVGPRYCPSIEDKIFKFPDKLKHQIFFEPEGLDTEEIYLNGVSTSLPEDVQWEFLRTIKGMERVQILRPGYAIEYDFVPPTQLKPSLETKKIRGLFHAGQINGTSGYEEAAAQGIMAGINAVLYVKGGEPLILSRSEAYIGVLIDDLVTKGTREPYRLFTSLAEYRLLLRQDNADLRLRDYGYKLGLVPEEVYHKFEEKRRRIETELQYLRKTSVAPSLRVAELLRAYASASIETPITCEQLLKRPELNLEKVLAIAGRSVPPPREVAEQVETTVKYQGYIERQTRQVERFKKLEEQVIPESFSFTGITALSRESREKLENVRPRSLGQASRISGVTPADISILMLHLATPTLKV